MLHSISGKITNSNPAEVYLLNNGICYRLDITLNTFEAINGQDTCTLFTHLHIKNEGQSFSGFKLYGFATEEERTYFEAIVSVSGIGTATARLMLSSMTPSEIANAIVLEDVAKITSVKGLGPKTAKRLILELKDKLAKIEVVVTGKENNASVSYNTMATEALSALSMLGFNKASAQKVVQHIIKTEEVDSVEEIIKLSLRKL